MADRESHCGGGEQRGADTTAIAGAGAYTPMTSGQSMNYSTWQPVSVGMQGGNSSAQLLESRPSAWYRHSRLTAQPLGNIAAAIEFPRRRAPKRRCKPPDRVLLLKTLGAVAPEPGDL